MSNDHDDPGASLALQLLRERYDTHAPSFTRAERLVADHLLQLPPEELAFLSAEDLAQATGTSDATVIRAARRLGFSGLPELKRKVTRSIAAHTPVAKRMERRFKAIGTDAAVARDAVFAAALELVETTQDAVDPTAIEQAVGLFEKAGTIWCLGIGMVEPPARHLAMTLFRAGLNVHVATGSGFTLANEMVNLGAGDVLVIFQPAQHRTDIEALIEHANAVGAGTVLISGVQLHERYRDRVTVSIQSMGVASRLASWGIGALVVADLLTHYFHARNGARTIEAHNRLQTLRQRLEGPPIKY